MNVQLFAYDADGYRYEVDLYEEEPILLNMAIENITDPSVVQSSYSKSFRVPATQHNSQVFQWWYEVNTIDFDVAQKVKAEIHVDGLLFKKGHVRIETAYLNGDADSVDLELVFYGETRDFATQVGTGFMHELDTSDATITIQTVTDISDTWTAVDAPIRFALCDRGYDWEQNASGAFSIVPGQHEVAFEYASARDSSFHKNAANAINITQFTPAVQIKYLIDKIFAETDFTYTADSVFNEEWFKRLYVDGNPIAAATFDQYLSDCDISYTKPQNQTLLSLDQWVPISFSNRVVDEGPFFDGTYYTIQYTENMAIDATIGYAVNAAFGSAVAIDIQMMLNSTPIATFNDSGISQIAGNAVLSYTSGQPALPAGAKVWFRAKVSSTQLFNAGWILIDSTLDITETTVVMTPSQLMRRDFKKMDAIKNIITKFRLVMEPSIDNENEFRIKPWQYYIGLGDKYDWTDKLDESKDTILKPLFYDQAAFIDFVDAEGEDQINTFHQDTYKKVYGQLLFDAKNDLLVDSKTISTMIIPTPVDQVVGLTNPSSNFIIPHLYRLDEGSVDNHGNALRVPSSPQPRIWFWNGMAAVDPATENWWYTDGTTDVNEDEYPRFTNVSELPTTNDTINLNWFKEFAYYDINRPSPIGTLGQSVYTKFWQYYIDSTYSSKARLMTAYFTLDAQDLKDLTFDDAIFIKNSWWRPVAIYDAPLSGAASVKVDLVKLLEYPGAQSGIFGDGGYGGGGGTWGPTSGTSGGNWGGTSSGTSGTSGSTSGSSGTSGLQTRYYELYPCDDEDLIIVGSFTGGVQPTIGKVCNVSGVAYAEKCYTIEREVQGPAVTTILQVFDTCEECQL